MLRTPRRAFRTLVSFLPALLVSACAESGTPESRVAGPEAPSLTVSDAFSSPGRDGFAFVAPFTNKTLTTGTFDAGLRPTVEICALKLDKTCEARLVQAIAFGNGGVQVDPTVQFYRASWNTSKVRGLQLGPDKYRVSVKVGALVVGFADLQLETSNEKLAAVTPAYIGGKAGSTLNISFTIRTGTVGTIAVKPQNATIFTGETLKYTAVVTDLRGNEIANSAVAWSTDDADRLSITETGVAIGGAKLGAAVVTAVSGGVSASTAATVNERLEAVTDRIEFTAGLVSSYTMNLLDNDKLGSGSTRVIRVKLLSGIIGPSFGWPYRGGRVATSEDGVVTFTNVVIPNVLFADDPPEVFTYVISDGVQPPDTGTFEVRVKPTPTASVSLVQTRTSLYQGEASLVTLRQYDAASNLIPYPKDLFLIDATVSGVAQISKPVSDFTRSMLVTLLDNPAEVATVTVKAAAFSRTGGPALLASTTIELRPAEPPVAVDDKAMISSAPFNTTGVFALTISGSLLDNDVLGNPKGTVTSFEIDGVAYPAGSQATLNIGGRSIVIGVGSNGRFGGTLLTSSPNQPFASEFTYTVANVAGPATAKVSVTQP